MSANNERSPYTPEWLRGVMKTEHPMREQRPSMIESLCVKPGQLPLQDHEVAQVVNEVRRIALEYGGSQQLRERLSTYLAPILKGERHP